MCGANQVLGMKRKVSASDAGRRPLIPRTVWALGLVSLFMDTSSEIIHALLPLFLTTTLGVSVLTVGIIDGIAEATASITKVFSGYISDRLRRRKALILIGYGLGAVSKPLFAIASSAGLVLVARFADRIGKGIRGAPRDALVADVTPLEIRGRAYGLRQALDTVGAFLGPLLAIGLMVLLANDMRAIFWIAVIPALIAVLCVVFGVRDREQPTPIGSGVPPPIRLNDVSRLPRTYWEIIILGAVFTLARFSESFLVLKANAVGLPLALAPLVLVIMNLVYAGAAFPAGVISDRVTPQRLLLVGMLLLIAADVVLALAGGVADAFVGIALWGAHLAVTQGLFAKLVAERAPDELRGTAFGVFNLITGVMLLFASVIAGLLWEFVGSLTTFWVGAGLAFLATLVLALTMRRRG